jgi:nicotinamide mononucleotide transporter
MSLFTSQPAELPVTILRWLFTHYIEVLATLTGMIYLVYSVQGKLLLWLFGIITSSLYVYVYLDSKIYALMSINIYYVFISIYGWIHWRFPGEKNKEELPVSRLSLRLSIYLMLISLLLFLVIIFVLKRYTNSDVAIWDAFISAFSITATWMLARKILEHWLIWIVVDLITVILSINKGLYPTVLLFIFYTSLAAIGFREWHKQWKNQREIVNV